ncbi:MAG: ABC transporter permease [Sulfurimonas sp.]|nr:ABC transporter permease [Sulfurimonas sp.]
MIIRFINTIGDATINISLAYYEAFVFTFASLLNIFNFHNYTSKTMEILVKQIYRTSIMVIPKFLAIAFFFGSLLIGLVIFIAADYGMDIKIGSIIVTFVVNEFSALFTALFIAYHFTPRIHAEIVFLVQKHKDALINSSIIAHIISAIVSNVSLSILFASVMIASGYVFTFLYYGYGFAYL